MANEFVLTDGKWVLQPAADLKFIDIEDLSSLAWTSSDVNSRLSSYSYNAGTKVHSFDLVTLSDISPLVYVDDSITTTAGNFNPPRWSRALVDENGVALDSNDDFILVGRLESYSSTVARNWAINIGFSRDNTSTNRPTVAWSGGQMGTSLGTGNTAVQYVFSTNGTSTGLAGGIRMQTYSLMRGSLASSKTLGGMSNMSNATDNVSASRTGGITFTSGIPLYLNLFATTLGNVSETTGGVISCTLSYAILRDIT